MSTAIKTEQIGTLEDGIHSLDAEHPWAVRALVSQAGLGFQGGRYADDIVLRSKYMKIVKEATEGLDEEDYYLIVKLSHEFDPEDDLKFSAVVGLRFQKKACMRPIIKLFRSTDISEMWSNLARAGHMLAKYGYGIHTKEQHDVWNALYFKGELETVDVLKIIKDDFPHYIPYFKERAFLVEPLAKTHNKALAVDRENRDLSEYRGTCHYYDLEEYPGDYRAALDEGRIFYGRPEEVPGWEIHKRHDDGRWWLQKTHLRGPKVTLEDIEAEVDAVGDVLDGIDSKLGISATKTGRTQAKTPNTSAPPQESVLGNIALMTLNGDRLELPQDKMFKNYEQVKSKLLDAGFKYKKNGFESPKAAELLERLLGGEKVNDKKLFQFFATCTDEVRDVQLLADVKDHHTVLEPSAGHGDLVEGIPKRQVQCFELFEDNVKILQEKGYQVTQGDFLEIPAQPIYDRILANPPFTKSQDIKHILHMYEFLKPGGRMVSIASTSWQQGSQKAQKDFRRWLAEVGAEIRQIDAGAFKESGTSIATTMILIDKE